MAAFKRTYKEGMDRAGEGLSGEEAGMSLSGVVEPVSHVDPVGT